MTDSFFGFETSLEGEHHLDEGDGLSDEDEEYDALNAETFGDSEFSGDWEEDHEKFAEITELSRHGNVSDPPHPNDHVEEPPKPKTRPPPGFFSSAPEEDSHFPTLPLPNFKNVCTVEELERDLIKRSNSFRLEDLERNLIPPKPQQPPLDILSSLRSNSIFGIGQPSPQINNHVSKIPPPPIGPFQHQQPRPPFILPAGGLARQPNMPVLRLLPPPHSPQLDLRVPVMGLPVPPPQPPEDEYAGLMTSKEKKWLAAIQLIQLKTNQPLQDDYYFTMYQMRHSGGRKVNNLKNAKDTPLLVKPTYTPLQFENSLGKLQIGSVMAPRKIIDTDVVESVDCSSTLSASKKVKQVLLEIEQMFALVLAAEEALTPMVTNENAVNPKEVFQKLVDTLLKRDKLKTILNVRKGQTLVLRILPHTEISGPLAHRLIKVLPFAAEKDREQALLRALPSIRHFLGSSSLETLVDLSRDLKPHLSFLLPNKFGVSVISNMIERAETLLSLLSETGDNANEWLSFVAEVVRQSETFQPERPVVGISGPTLAKHLSRCPQANNQDVVILLKALSNLSTQDKSKESKKS